MLSLKPNVERMESRQDYAGLVKALRNKDRYVRRAAVEGLRRMSGPVNDSQRNVNELIKALRGHHDVQDVAVALLTAIGGPAVEPLIAELQGDNELGRWGAARALAEIGDQRAVGPLAEALALAASRNVVVIDFYGRSTDNPFRAAAADALTKLGHGSAVREVMDLEALRVRLESLPSRYATTATALGPGAEQAREQVPIICRTIDDAVQAIRSGLDPEGRPITLSQVGDGLLRLVDDVSGAGFSGLMHTVMNPDGVRELERAVSELAEIGSRLAAS